MCTDTTLSALDIIGLYGLRFKIEHTFKQAVRVIGALSYHFWMKKMKPLRHRNGNQYLHRESLDYRNAVKRKINAYHLFIQAGLVSQGLLQYLAAVFPQLVWDSFGSWLRTIRPGIPPPNWSWPPPYASACRNFSWIPRKTIPSRNSSSTGKTPIKWRYSDWLDEEKSGLLSMR